ncbi:MAG: hypothetical protein IJU16_01415 [Clostridia bacterium]|nr:hypothetical protein [Clostridia bacterium]
MSRASVHTFALPPLSGGIDYEKPPDRIEDDTLAAAENVWWHNGQLKMRPAFSIVSNGNRCEESWNSYIHGSDFCGRKPVRITWEGEDAFAVMVQKRKSTRTEKFFVYVFASDGVLRRTWTLENDLYTILDAAYALLLPGGASRYPFLVYTRNGDIYCPGTEETAVASGVYALVPVPEEEIYVPTIFLNGAAYHTGDNVDVPTGTMVEGFNLFSDRFRCCYTTTASDSGNAYQLFKLPVKLQSGKPVTVTYTANDGKVYTGTADGEHIENGIQYFDLCDAAGARYMSLLVNYTYSHISVNIQSGNPYFPTSTISDNLEVVAYREHRVRAAFFQNAAIADGCYFGGTGGSRLFLLLRQNIGGEDPFHDRVLWSEPGMPFYVSENSYAYVGNSSDRITALEVQAQFLTVFKEHSTYVLTCQNEEIDADSVTQGSNVDIASKGIAMSIRLLSDRIGCGSPGTIVRCLDRLTWMTSDGSICTLMAATAYNDHNIVEIGRAIGNRLRATSTSAERRKAVACVADGRYFLAIGSRMYLFDIRDQGFANLSYFSKPETIDRHIAWYEWRLPEDEAVDKYLFGEDKLVLLKLFDFYEQSQAGSSTQCAVAAMRLESDTADAPIDRVARRLQGGTIEMTTEPVMAYFETKRFLFGSIVAFKRIKALFLKLDGTSCRIRPIVDGTMLDPITIEIHPNGQMLPLSVARCRSFGLRVESDRAVAAGSLAVEYSRFGAVR